MIVYYKYFALYTLNVIQAFYDWNLDIQSAIIANNWNSAKSYFTEPWWCLKVISNNDVIILI